MALAVAVGTGDDAGAEAGVVSRSSGVRSGVDTRRDPSEACADRSGADELRGMLGCCCCACPGAPYTSMSGCTFQAKPPGVDASCDGTRDDGTIAKVTLDWIFGRRGDKFTVSA